MKSFRGFFKKVYPQPPHSPALHFGFFLEFPILIGSQSLMINELKQWLREEVIATSRTTSYKTLKVIGKPNDIMLLFIRLLS